MGASGQREEGTRRSRYPARASSLRSSSFPAHDSPDGNTKETEFDRWLERMEERERERRTREGEESLQYQECKFWEPDSLSQKKEEEMVPSFFPSPSDGVGVSSRVVEA